MWHMTGVCCLCAACSKSLAGEECQSSFVPLQSFQYLQLRLWWHPTGTSRDFSSENDCNVASLRSGPWTGARRCFVHIACYQQATAQLRSHELGCPPLPGQWCKPYFQWRKYLAPSHSPMVQLDITSQYLVRKHKGEPFSTNGTVAHAYSPVEGMVSRWMVDANGFNRLFHLIWRWLLLVVPIHDHMVSDHHFPVESCAGWTTSKSDCKISP